MPQKVVYSNQVPEVLDSLIKEMNPANVFILVDANSAESAQPLVRVGCESLANAQTILIPADDVNKTPETLNLIWKQLSDGGATRQSVLINLGGGMVTDIGGFAAATFKRGIFSINVPTTLLGAVDAALGGKTGVNLNGLKNEVGVFSEADAVIISTLFFNTLPQQQILSGYAEMIKHGLLDSNAELAELLKFNIDNPLSDPDTLLRLIQTSVGIKRDIVAMDPYETGKRKSLNLGHTAGHAFETFAMTDRKSPIPHGYAVAWGLVVELILSQMIMGFPSDTLHAFAKYIKEHYGYYMVTCDDYPRLIEIMGHDKKNDLPSQINFTLLTDVGEPHINQTVAPDKISAALDIYRDLME